MKDLTPPPQFKVTCLQQMTQRCTQHGKVFSRAGMHFGWKLEIAQIQAKSAHITKKTKNELFLKTVQDSVEKTKVQPFIFSIFVLFCVCFAKTKQKMCFAVSTLVQDARLTSTFPVCMICPIHRVAKLKFPKIFQDFLGFSRIF